MLNSSFLTRMDACHYIIIRGIMNETDNLGEKNANKM